MEKEGSSLDGKLAMCLTRKEVRALGRILMKHYIDYHDDEAHTVVNRIFRTIDGMAARTSTVNE